ncbi:hypothetical protein RF11_13259 [Thelohanellus kitauei]|uniref:Uncharacterized protein n=1 Tax=Thelohanellus kitauei TaxID=669202 RepID=A0A0C2NEX1_THEKT|nr:hypothetical protein RF11_13259 [Thelohanellus kitauei]
MAQVSRILISRPPTDEYLRLGLFYLSWSLFLIANQNLLSSCVVAKLSPFIHIPFILFWLTMLETLLFVVYHTSVGINSFKIPLKQSINVVFNRINGGYDLLPNEEEIAC